MIEPVVIGDATLYLGDCLEVLPTLPDASVDAVIADPPYNVGCPYDEYDDRRPADEYESWCSEWFTECRRVARQVVIFPGHGNLGMWHRIERPSGVGCWHKPGNPARGGVFQFCEWEPFLVYGGCLSQSDVIRATVSQQRAVGAHPCPKPLSLIVELIGRMRNVSTVLDPFAGSFTTAVACLKAGVSFIGCELSAAYFAAGLERLRECNGDNGLFAQKASELFPEVA